MNRKEVIGSYKSIRKRRADLYRQFISSESDQGKIGKLKEKYNELSTTSEEALIKIAIPLEIPKLHYDIFAYSRNRSKNKKQKQRKKSEVNRQSNRKWPLVSWAAEVAEEIDPDFSIEKHIHVFKDQFTHKKNLDFLERTIQAKRNYFAIVIPTIKASSESKKGRVIFVNPNYGCTTYIVPKKDWQKYAEMNFTELKKLSKAFETNPQDPNVTWITRYEMPKKSKRETVPEEIRWKRDLSVLLRNKPSMPKKQQKWNKKPIVKRGSKRTLQEKIKLIETYQKETKRKVPIPGHPVYTIVESLRAGVRARIDDNKVNNQKSYTTESEQLEFERVTGIPLDPSKIKMGLDEERIKNYLTHFKKCIEYMKSNKGKTPPESCGTLGSRLSYIRRGFSVQIMVDQGLPRKNRRNLPREIARLYLKGDPMVGGIWLNRDENGNIEDQQTTLGKIDNGEIYKAGTESDPLVNKLFRRMAAQSLSKK